MTPEEQVVLDAKRMVSRGAWGILFGLGVSALLVIVFVALAAVFDQTAVVMAIVVKLAVLPLLGVLYGTIRVAQGGLMLLTGMRIEVEGRHPLKGSEMLLTGVFALGWVGAIVGGFALVLFR